jgi:hypothetical protein
VPTVVSHALGNRPDINIAVLNVPAFLSVVIGLAAGELMVEFSQTFFRYTCPTANIAAANTTANSALANWWTSFIRVG